MLVYIFPENSLIARKECVFLVYRKYLFSVTNYLDAKIGKNEFFPLKNHVKHIRSSCCAKIINNSKLSN